jgi:hypothetical protein
MRAPLLDVWTTLGVSFTFQHELEEDLLISPFYFGCLILKVAASCKNQELKLNPQTNCLCGRDAAAVITHCI